MAAFEVLRTMQWLESHAKKMGLFKLVQLGEPKAPPVDLTMAFFMSSAIVTHMYANGGTGEQHIIIGRVHMDLLAEPADKVEANLAKIVSKYMNLILADSDLGATIKTIDVAGMSGEALGAKWGIVTIDNKMFRVVDITIPCLVDDSATASP